LLGLSSWTIASVIGMSLLGLALGNLWGGRKPRSKSRSESPLKFASLLLCGTGLAVLLLPAMFWLISSIDTTHFDSALTGGGGVGKLWILAVASPTLLVHFFAGAVFPALLHGRDSTAAKLTLLLSGAAAMLVGGCVWRMTKGAVADPPETVSAALLKLSPRIGVAIFLAGIASLGLEVVWQRVLILLVGTDAYSLTIVVVAYLIGIAAGAAVAALWLKVDMKSTGTKWTTRVAVLQLAGALVSVLVLAALVYLASGPGQAWLNCSFFRQLSMERRGRCYCERSLGKRAMKV